MPIRQVVGRYEKLLTDNGGDIHAGRKLARLLRDAGFEAERLSATYEIYEDTVLIADYPAAQLDTVGTESGTVFRVWGRLPSSTFAQAGGEAIGRKPA